jgi:cytochrome P450
MTTGPFAGVLWDADREAFRVTSYDLASAVLRGEGWSSDLQRNPLINEELKDSPGGGLITLDPPEHTRQRRLVSPAFTPRAVESLRPRVASIVEAVLDGLPGEFDVVADVGYPVALAVICELLDVGVEGAELFADMTPRLARGLEFDATIEDLIAAAVATTEMTLFLTPLLAARRSDPGQDFISALLALSDDHHPDGLSLGEVMSTCLLLLIAGHETTANLIATSTLALLQDPTQIPHLLADPARAVEELLRRHGPVKLLLRTALTAHALGGVHVAAGQAVLVDVPAANHDPSRFPDAARMDLTREPAGHLALGAGIHFCLGAALARLEATETLTRLFTRFPDLALTDDQVSWRDSATLHALTGLPVTVCE